MGGRVQQLDVLRGVAVLLVLVHHSPGGEGASLRAGWTGVDLFFVLSGFLVSGLLFKEHLRTGRIRAGRFYVRRGLKIYPSFYTMLAVTSALLAAAGVTVPPRNVVHEIVFLQNYLPVAWWGREHAWSLAIEEHFYFLLPPALALLLRSARFRRAPVRWAAGLSAALGLAALSVRWTMVRSDADASDVLFLTHTRLDSLAFGVLLSVVWHFTPARIATIRRLRWALLPAGRIYLWHLPLLAVVRNTLGAQPAGIVAFYAGSIAGGVVMARLVEIPALRLRERWVPAQAAA